MEYSEKTAQRLYFEYQTDARVITKKSAPKTARFARFEKVFCDGLTVCVMGLIRTRCTRSFYIAGRAFRAGRRLF